MLEYQQRESERVRKLRLMRPGFMEEGRLHEFLRDAYAGTGGFRNGQVPTPSVTFWGIRSYERGWGSRDSWWNLYVDTRKAFNDRKPGQSPGPARQSWSYIQPFPGEDNFTYLDRVNNSNYVNNVQPIVRVTNSFLTKEDAQRENVPDKIAEWIKSVTPDRKHIREHAKNVCWRGQVVGWCATLVDMPNGIPAANLADSEAAEVRPYLTTYWPQEIWDYDISPSGEILAIKFVREHEVERTSMLDEKMYVQEIVCWYRDHWEKYIISVPGPIPDGMGINPGPGKYNRIIDESSGPNPFVDPKTGRGVVPVSFFRWDEALDNMPFTGQPQILALAQIARKQYNQQSELDYMMRAQVFGQLVGPINASGAPGATQGTIQVGYGNFLPEPIEGKGIWRYISPDGSVSETYESALERNKRDGYRISLIDAGEGKQAETAEGRKLRFQQTDAMLASAAENLDRWEKAILRFVSYFYRIPDEEFEAMVIRRKREYAIISLNDAIDGALKVLDLDIGVEASVSIVTRMVLTQLPDVSEAKSLEIQTQIRTEITKALGKTFTISGDPQKIETLTKKFEWISIVDRTEDDSIDVAVASDKVAMLVKESEKRGLTVKPRSLPATPPVGQIQNEYTAGAPAAPESEPAPPAGQRPPQEAAQAAAP